MKLRRITYVITGLLYLFWAYLEAIGDHLPTFVLTIALFYVGICLLLDAIQTKNR